MSPDVAAMRRGMGGRVEEAFAAAKEAGRAAFVTFVTAGYPRAEGASVLLPCDSSSLCGIFVQHNCEEWELIVG